MGRLGYPWFLPPPLVSQHFSAAGENLEGLVLDPAVHGRGRRRLNLRGSPDIYELDRAKALAKVAARPGNRFAIAEGLRPSMDDVCMFHNNP